MPLGFRILRVTQCLQTPTQFIAADLRLVHRVAHLSPMSRRLFLGAMVLEEYSVAICSPTFLDIANHCKTS